MCISHFPRFSVFYAILQALQCAFLIFHVFHFSCHIPVPRVCISHFPRFSVFLAIFQVLQCTFLIFHVFQVFFFLPYSRSYSVYLSFSTFFSFLTVIQAYSVHFSFSTFFSVSHHIRFHIVCLFYFSIKFPFSQYNNSFFISQPFSTTKL